MNFKLTLFLGLFYIFNNTVNTNQPNGYKIFNIFTNKKFKNAKPATIFKDSIVILDEHITNKNSANNLMIHSTIGQNLNSNNQTIYSKDKLESTLVTSKPTESSTTIKETSSRIMTWTKSPYVTTIKSSDLKNKNMTLNQNNKLNYTLLFNSIYILYDTFRKHLKNQLSSLIKSDKSKPKDLTDELKNNSLLLSNSLRMLINIVNSDNNTTEYDSIDLNNDSLNLSSSVASTKYFMDTTKRNNYFNMFDYNYLTSAYHSITQTVPTQASKNTGYTSIAPKNINQTSTYQKLSKHTYNLSYGPTKNNKIEDYTKNQHFYNYFNRNQTNQNDHTEYKYSTIINNITGALNNISTKISETNKINITSRYTNQPDSSFNSTFLINKTTNSMIYSSQKKSTKTSFYKDDLKETVKDGTYSTYQSINNFLKDQDFTTKLEGFFQTIINSIKSFKISNKDMATLNDEQQVQNKSTFDQKLVENLISTLDKIENDLTTTTTTKKLSSKSIDKSDFKTKTIGILSTTSIIEEIQTEIKSTTTKIDLIESEEVLSQLKKSSKPFLYLFKLTETPQLETNSSNNSFYKTDKINDSDESSLYTTTTELTEIEKKINQLKYTKNCSFPFIYKNKTFNQCITLDKKFPWCSLTSNFDQDSEWKYCDDPHLNTIGGNSNGSKCFFPFKYQGKIYNSCINRQLKSDDGTITYPKFCSTTDDYDRDGLWGYCLDYSECHFPFIYKGNVYTNCISNNLSPSFCSTTYDFNKDKEWMHCPVVCPGYPDKSHNVISFDYLDKNMACHPRKHIHRLNGLKLRDYVLPPCTLDYSCEPGYRKLFKSIQCKIDGAYDKKAFCLSEQLFQKSNNNIQISNGNDHN